MSKKKIVIGVILGILVAILATVYLVGRSYFTTHYYPKTTINGVDVSKKTKEEAEVLVKEELAKYALGILSEDKPMMITAAQSGLEYTGIEDLGKILDNQQEDVWFQEFMGVHENKAMGVKIDENVLHETFASLSCLTPTTPRESTDARIEFNEAQNDFVVVDETIGNIVQQDLLYEAIKNAILNGEELIDLKTNEYYVQPKYFAKDQIVVDTKATLDKYLGTVINYEDMGVSFTLDREGIKTFLTVDPDFKIEFNSEVMKQYVQDNICPVFNTVGTVRTFNSPGSGWFNAGGGTYGWQVGLIAERDAMKKDIENGAQVTRAPEYLQDAKIKDRTNDVGSTFVDVNIEKQHLWVVKDGISILDSAFVSGDVTKGRETKLGIYQVERNERNYKMVNFNVTVKYWMPFNLDFGEGFHDASWRGKFGGSIYKGNGSHGCINLPPKIAKKMFGIVSKGYPVIVH